MSCKQLNCGELAENILLRIYFLRQNYVQKNIITSYFARFELS